MTKNQITEYIKAKGIFEEVDMIMVDELLFNLKVIKEAKKDISNNGLVINTSKGPNPYYQQSPSVSIYNNAVKNVMNLSRKLALSPLDRANLKISVEEEDDGF